MKFTLKRFLQNSNFEKNLNRRRNHQIFQQKRVLQKPLKRLPLTIVELLIAMTLIAVLGAIWHEYPSIISRLYYHSSVKEFESTLTLAQTMAKRLHTPVQVVVDQDKKDPLYWIVLKCELPAVDSNGNAKNDQPKKPTFSEQQLVARQKKCRGVEGLYISDSNRPSHIVFTFQGTGESTISDDIAFSSIRLKPFHSSQAMQPLTLHITEELEDTRLTQQAKALFPKELYE